MEKMYELNVFSKKKIISLKIGRKINKERDEKNQWYCS